jgi:hypothetical protein
MRVPIKDAIENAGIGDPIAYIKTTNLSVARAECHDFVGTGSKRFAQKRSAGIGAVKKMSRRLGAAYSPPCGDARRGITPDCNFFTVVMTCGHPEA